MVQVEVVYVTRKQETIRFSLTLDAGALVQDALTRSGLYDLYPETKNYQAGIYARLCSLDTVLRDGDRVEIYRPLLIDPKDKRRRLAKKK